MDDLSPPTPLAPPDDGLPVPDRPFRVEAGPGAGKTRWLVEHVGHTLGSGTRLGGRGRIACITYTQVGTEALQARLRGRLDRLWISTIHSFLYHHLVRPYAHRLGITELNTAALDGHGPLRRRVGYATAWLGALGMDPRLWHTAPNLSAILSHNLEHALEWTLRTDGTWALSFSARAKWQGITHPRQNPKDHYNRHEPLLAYKYRYWAEGHIDHDDVIYLSHRLLTEHPDLASALVRRFPYVYLDEYQDTTPAQSDLVEALADAGATVGVIGDVAQSIFGFTGAGPTHYARFAPDGCIRHTLLGNWRSTQPIVDVLNRYRRDGLVQSSRRAVDPGRPPSPPRLFVGALPDAYAEAAREVGEQGTLHLVARSHPEVAELVRVAAGRSGVATPWDALVAADEDRGHFLQALCRAVRRAGDGRHRDAMRELRPLFRSGGHLARPLHGNAASALRRRSLAFLLQQEVERLSRLSGATALNAYRSLEALLLQDVPGVRLTSARDGAGFARAAEVPLHDLLDTVSLDGPTGLARTIHAFKGDQARAVFLYVTKETLLRRLHAPDDHEDTRLLYVALSRAQDHLFVCVPGSDPAFDSVFTAMGYAVERLPSALNVLPAPNGPGQHKARR